MFNPFEAINPLTAATAADPDAVADVTTSMQWIDSSVLRGCNIRSAHVGKQMKPEKRVKQDSLSSGTILGHKP